MKRSGNSWPPPAQSRPTPRWARVAAFVIVLSVGVILGCVVVAAVRWAFG